MRDLVGQCPVGRQRLGWLAVAGDVLAQGIGQVTQLVLLAEAEFAFEAQGQAQVIDLQHIEVVLDVGTQRIDFLEEAFTGQVHTEVAELQRLQLEVLAQFVIA
ncbi:hypothetical protein D3C78_1415470 [compost metagenome]